MSKEESETMKSISANLREGLDVKKLLRVAKEAKDSVEEKEAQKNRLSRLLAAIELQDCDDMSKQAIDDILREKTHLPLPRNPGKSSSSGRCFPAGCSRL
jgi:hypothetical protein